MVSRSIHFLTSVSHLTSLWAGPRPTNGVCHMNFWPLGSSVTAHLLLLQVATSVLSLGCCTPGAPDLPGLVRLFWQFPRFGTFSHIEASQLLVPWLGMPFSVSGPSYLQSSFKFKLKCHFPGESFVAFNLGQAGLFYLPMTPRDFSL